MPNCSIDPYNVSAYPGEDFTLRLAVVGNAMNGITRGVITANVKNYNDKDYSHYAWFGPLQHAQQNINGCEDTVFSSNRTFDIFVGYYQYQGTRLIYPHGTIISMHLKDCPLGFALQQDIGACTCDPAIRRDDIHCNINDLSILRPAWAFTTQVTPMKLEWCSVSTVHMGIAYLMQ